MCPGLEKASRDLHNMMKGNAWFFCVGAADAPGDHHLVVYTRYRKHGFIPTEFEKYPVVVQYLGRVTLACN
jgi:hypothetical protein